MHNIGKKSESFNITLNENFFKQGDILVPIKGEQSFRVISDTKTHNNKWYHKLINFFTFGKCLNIYYTFDIELNANGTR